MRALSKIPFETVFSYTSWAKKVPEDTPLEKHLAVSRALGWWLPIDPLSLEGKVLRDSPLYLFQDLVGLAQIPILKKLWVLLEFWSSYEGILDPNYRPGVEYVSTSREDMKRLLFNNLIYRNDPKVFSWIIGLNLDHPDLSLLLDLVMEKSPQYFTLPFIKHLHSIRFDIPDHQEDLLLGRAFRGEIEGILEFYAETPRTPKRSLHFELHSIRSPQDIETIRKILEVSEEDLKEILLKKMKMSWLMLSPPTLCTQSEFLNIYPKIPLSTLRLYVEYLKFNPKTLMKLLKGQLDQEGKNYLRSACLQQKFS